MDFINFLMTANERRYYVSLLSAAELYGAAHQRPQVFQVMVDRSFEDRSFGRVRLQFYSRANLNAVPVKLVNSRVDQVRVSTPAATCLDLATRPLDSGGLSNVATVLSELVAEQTVSAEQLVDAAQAFPAASLRRLGWLLDHVDAALDRDKLAAILSNRSSGRATALLDPKGVRRGSGTNRWNVVVNSEVEADL
jgi:predicted transcriptional regulator of viral defense system